MERDETKDRGPRYSDWEHTRPVGGIVLTLVAVIAWLVFILLYALFWSGNYNLFQNIVVTVVTLGITAASDRAGLGRLGLQAREELEEPG